LRTRDRAHTRRDHARQDSTPSRSPTFPHVSPSPIRPLVRYRGHHVQRVYLANRPSRRGLGLGRSVLVVREGCIGRRRVRRRRRGGWRTRGQRGGRRRRRRRGGSGRGWERSERRCRRFVGRWWSWCGCQCRKRWNIEWRKRQRRSRRHDQRRRVRRQRRNGCRRRRAVRVGDVQGLEVRPRRPDDVGVGLLHRRWHLRGVDDPGLVGLPSGGCGGATAPGDVHAEVGRNACLRRRCSATMGGGRCSAIARVRQGGRGVRAGGDARVGSRCAP